MSKEERGTHMIKKLPKREGMQSRNGACGIWDAGCGIWETEDRI